MSTVNLRLKGRRIEVRSSAPLSGMKSTIPGAYLATGGYWTVPLSMETCRLLREKFGKRLEIHPELTRWAKQVSSSRKYMSTLAAQDDAELEHLATAAPAIAEAMANRRYQRVGVRFIADSTAPLIADDPGLGKTLQVMGGILEAQVPGPYLVVAPKTAGEAVWASEIARWLPSDHRAVTLPEFRHQRERTIRLSRYGDKTWLIVHPEVVMVQAYWVCQERVKRRHKRTGKVAWRVCGRRSVQGPMQKRDLDCGHIRDRATISQIVPSYPKLFEVDWGAIILDESHESLIRRKGVPTQRRRGLDMLRVRSDGMRVAISGTPFDSKPHQLWGTLNWLDPKQYSAFHRWAELFWRKGKYHEIEDFIKEREPLLWESLSAVALRRTKAEVAQDLPPKLYVGTPLDPQDATSPIGVWLDMEDKQAAAYKALEATSVAELDTGRIESITVLDELTRLKQLASAYGRIEPREVKVRCQSNPARYPIPCANCKAGGWHTEMRHDYHPEMPSNKYKWVAESLEEWGYPRDPLTKVVVVSWYTGILNMFGEALERRFKTKPGNPLCAYITGKVPIGQRKATIDAFNRRDPGTPQVMMLNVKAGGTAITLDTADRMIFLSETRIPDQQKQAEDRIHRISNPRQCMYYHLRSRGTVDVGTALIGQELDQQSHRLLDGRRGVEYVRRVLDLSKGFD